ncbi:MAG: heme ABC exporter ATP-binding protein CcmA [Candidatus Latescibacterota bacterium]|jgi:heme exporter protein A
MTPAEAISLDRVSKRYAGTAALAEVDLRLPAGTFLLLLGPNGAGKSTLLRLLAGLARPTGGRVLVCGEDPHASADARRAIGLLSHQTLLYDDLTPLENLRFFARLYGLADGEARIAAALAAAGLGPRERQRVRTFSRGMKQRLALARANLHGPTVLLLDEPFTGLDAAGIEGLCAQLQDWRRQGRTGVLVTHQLEPAVALADDLLVLHRGRVCGHQPWRGDSVAELSRVYAALVEGAR